MTPASGGATGRPEPRRQRIVSCGYSGCDAHMKTFADHSEAGPFYCDAECRERAWLAERDGLLARVARLEEALVQIQTEAGKPGAVGAICGRMCGIARLALAGGKGGGA